MFKRNCVDWHVTIGCICNLPLLPKKTCCDFVTLLFSTRLVTLSVCLAPPGVSAPSICQNGRACPSDEGLGWDALGCHLLYPWEGAAEHSEERAEDCGQQQDGQAEPAASPARMSQGLQEQHYQQLLAHVQHLLMLQHPLMPQHQHCSGDGSIPR